MCVVFVDKTASIQHLRKKVFPASLGSVETTIRCGGKIKQLLIAHFLGNIFAKKFQNLHSCHSYDMQHPCHFLRNSVDATREPYTAICHYTFEANRTMI